MATVRYLRHRRDSASKELSHTASRLTVLKPKLVSRPALRTPSNVVCPRTTFHFLLLVGKFISFSLTYLYFPSIFSLVTLLVFFLQGSNLHTSWDICSHPSSLHGHTIEASSCYKFQNIFHFPFSPYVIITKSV